MTELHWLPSVPDWRQRLRALPANPATAWEVAVALANARLNFVLTNALDETVRRVLPNGPETLATKKVRLAVAGIVHPDPPPAWHPGRRPAPGDLDRHLRERLRAILAGTVRSRLAAARLQADRRPHRAGCLSPDRRCHRRNGRRHRAARP